MTAALSGEREVYELQRVCEVRSARPEEQISGGEIRCVAAPRTVVEVSALLEYAHSRHLVVMPAGRRSKLGWQEPPPVIDILLDLSAFATCSYDPKSTLLHAGAGTSVAQAQRLLADAGRRLALDPPSPDASLGGTLVGAEVGPMTYRYGPPAAQLVDATVVLPDGTVCTVAEQERLLGSAVCDLRWAQPAWPQRASIVVDVTLRTFPLPPAQTWIMCPLAHPQQIGSIRAEVSAADVAPVAVELEMPGRRRDLPPSATADGTCVRPLPSRRRAAGTVAVLLEGSQPSLSDRAARLTTMLGSGAFGSTQPPAWWGRYPFRPDEIAVRLNVADEQVHTYCYVLADAVGRPVPIRGSIGADHLWAALPGDLTPRHLTRVLHAVRSILLSRGGSAVVCAAPVSLHPLVAAYREP